MDYCKRTGNKRISKTLLKGTGPEQTLYVLEGFGERCGVQRGGDWRCWWSEGPGRSPERVRTGLWAERRGLVRGISEVDLGL